MFWVIMMNLVKTTLCAVMLAGLFLLTLSGCEMPEYRGQTTEMDFAEKIKPAAVSEDAGESDMNNEDDTVQSENEPVGAFVTLSHRSKGEMVGKVQKRLIELKYLHSEVTEYYGDATESAVAAFQRASGLDVTGDVDEETYNALMAENAKESELLLTGVIIGIDPGCQRHSDHEQEPVAPDSDEMKNKATTGATGEWTGANEYDINMKIAKLLQEALTVQGASVFLTHDDIHVNMSNIERANYLNEHNAMLSVVLRCNSVNDSDTHGAFCMIAEDPDTESERAAEAVLSAFCKATDAKNLGVLLRDDQTILNWCEGTTICLEMGHMSNRHEDRNLSDESYQAKMVRGITDGIIDYISGR